ncbi:MAG: hypothetical protein WCA81_04620 [Rhizomicrobium sp.]
MSHTIRFRRPETPYGVSRMVVPPEVDAAGRVRHLESLGYSIVDVTPPLQRQVPVEKLTQESF